MTRIYPPDLTLGLNASPYTLAIPSGSIGVFRLREGSLSSTAEVTEEGIVTPRSEGQVFIEVVSGSTVLASSSVTISAEVLAEVSHISDSDPGKSDIYFEEQLIDRGSHFIVKPIIIYSDGSRPFVSESKYRVLVSRDGSTFYDTSTYSQFIPEISIKKVIDSGRFAYKITAVHASSSPFVIRIQYVDEDIVQISQDIYLKIKGPAAISYSPNYAPKSLEVDLGTTLDLNASVLYSDDRVPTSLVDFTSLSPEILSINSSGLITPLRVTETAFPSFSNSKEQVWSFAKAKDIIYAAVGNKVFKFDQATGYGEVLFQFDNNINIRSISILKDLVVYLYISIKKQDTEPPKSVVYRFYISNPILQPVGKVDRVGTAFSLAEGLDSKFYCVLATREANQSYVYVFSHNLENQLITQHKVTSDQTFVKAVAVAKNWVCLLSESGIVFLYNLKTNSLQNISVGFSNVQALSASSIPGNPNQAVVWFYRNQSGEVQLHSRKLTFTADLTGLSQYLNATVDYGSLNTPPDIQYINRADVIDNVHYLVFTYLPPDRTKYADPPPSNPEYHGLSVEPQSVPGDTSFINDHVGFLDLSHTIVGQVQISSQEDSFIKTTVDVIVHPSNTKNPYAFKYSVSELNLPTEVDNIVPVQVVFSDGTFSYNTTAVSQARTFTSGGFLYARSDEYLQDQLAISYSGIGVTIPTNFYPTPISVGIGSPDRIASVVKVKEGSIVEMPTYIFTPGPRLYEYPLIVSGNDTTVATVTNDGTVLVISGTVSGDTEIVYRTPQPLSSVISGTLLIEVTGAAVPDRIHLPDVADGSIYVAYRPIDLLHPEPYSYPRTISGQVIFSDNTRSEFNDNLVWSVTSGSDNFSVSGSTFYFTPPLAGPNPIGKGKVLSLIEPTVEREFYLRALECQDTTPVDIILPKYVTDYENFVKFANIPQNRITFQILRANNTRIYGNNVATFTVDGQSVSVIPNSLGTLTVPTGEFGISTLTIQVGDIEKKVYIQVGGPNSIVPNLPFYKVDAGATLGYVSGTIFDVNGEVLDGYPLEVSSSRPLEVVTSEALVSGVLRGSCVEFLPTPLEVPLQLACTTEDGSLAIINAVGKVIVFDNTLTPKINKKYEHANQTPYVFDILRTDAGVLGFEIPEDKTYLYRNDGGPDFTAWGPISGTVLDISILKSRVYFTRLRNNTRELGFIRRNAKSPKATLDYAVTLLSGVVNPEKIVRDGNKLVCITTDNKVFIVDEDNQTGFTPIQIFNNSQLASSQFNLTLNNTVQNRSLNILGSFPTEVIESTDVPLKPISGGPTFYFTNSSKTRVYRYTPLATASTVLNFTAKNYSKQTNTSRLVTVLPSGFALDYYLTFEIPNSDLLYIGDTSSVNATVYNSSGHTHQNVDVFLGGVKQPSTTFTFKSGGSVEVRVVSRNDSTVYAIKNVQVRRRVKSVALENFNEDDGTVSVNVDSSVPLEAFVLYEDGYIDSRAILDIPVASADNIGQATVGSALYLTGIEVTPGATSVPATLKAIETQIAESGSSFKNIKARVYPAGTKKLSTLNLDSTFTANEKSQITSGVAAFYYTDGTVEPVFAEGFRSDLTGLQTYNDLLDLTISEDSLYVLRADKIHIYTQNGALREVIDLPENSGPFRKIRVYDSVIYLSERSRVVKLEQDQLVLQYGNDADVTEIHNIVDFSVTAESLFVLDITDQFSKLCSVRSSLAPTDEITSLPVDINSFTRLADGTIYFASPSLGILDSNKSVISSVSNVNHLTHFGEELYATLDHQIVRVLSNGTVDYIAGSIFAGLTNGEGELARFNHPTSLAIDTSRQLFVLDAGNSTLRRVTDTSVTALIGNIWTTDDHTIAYGVGNTIVTGKPGVANLAISYQGITRYTTVSVLPVYTRIQLTNPSYKTILGEQSQKQSLALSATAYTLSGPATGSYIASINYPAPIIWGCSQASYLNGNILTPTKTGSCLIEASLGGVSGITSSTRVLTEAWAATGITFDREAYFIATNDVIDFAQKAKFAYNDGQLIGSVDIIYAGTTYGSQLTKAGEYEGQVSASGSGLSTSVPVYVYTQGARLVYNTDAITLYSGTSRNISAYHTGTVLFKNRFINYQTSDSIKDFVSISSGGIITALSGVNVTGNVGAFSQMLSSSSVKPVTVTTTNLLSNFDNYTTPYVLQSGNKLPLSKVTVSYLDSQNTTGSSLLTEYNFSLPSGSKAKLSKTVVNGQIVDVLEYASTGTLSRFSGVYRHSLTDLPPTSVERTVSIPFLSVAPTGIQVTVDGNLQDKLYVVAGDRVITTLELLYNDNYKDQSFSVEPPIGSTYTILSDDSQGVLSVSGIALENGVNSASAPLTVTYNFDSKKQFSTDVIVTRFRLVRDVSIQGLGTSVVCLELTPLQELFALVSYTNNTSNQRYGWYVDGVASGNSPSLDLTDIPSGKVVYAESLDIGINDTKVKSSDVYIYQKLADITNPDHLSELARLGLLSPRLAVKFEPNFNVQLDLGATLQEKIEPYATINGVRDPGKHTLLPNADNMLDTGIQAIFARKIQSLASKSNLVVGNADVQVYTSTIGANTYLFRDNPITQAISTGISWATGIAISGGFVIATDLGLIAVNKNAVFSSGSLLFDYITPIQDNLLAGISGSTLRKITVDFETSKFKLGSSASITTPIRTFFTTPSGKFLYITDDGLCTFANPGFIVVKSGTFTGGAAIDENKFFLVNGREVSYFYRLLDDFYSLGSIPESFGNIINIQKYSESDVLATTQNGYSLLISKAVNTTQLVVQHVDNANLQARLTVQVLAPPQAKDYIIAFAPTNPVVKQSEFFNVSGLSFNSNGSYTELTVENGKLSYDSNFLEYPNGQFKTKTYGQTFITGTTTTLTGVNLITALPIVTGIEVSSDYLQNATSQSAITSGTYMPYVANALYSDGTKAPDVTVASALANYSDNLLFGHTVGTGILTITAKDDSTQFIEVPLTVLSGDDVRVSKFIVADPSPINLVAGESHFIDTTVYYTNATSDQFVYTTLDAASSGLRVVDSNVIEAFGLDSGHEAIVRPSTVSKIPADLVTSGSLIFKSDVTFGTVKTLGNSSTPTGLRIASITPGSEEVYFDFQSRNLVPTITEVGTTGSFFSLQVTIDTKDSTLLQFIFEPKYTPVDLPVQLKVSLPGYELEGAVFTYLIRPAQPTLAFRTGTQVVQDIALVSDGSSRVDLDLVLKYDRNTVQVIPDEYVNVVGLYVDRDRSQKWFLKATKSNASLTTKVTGSYIYNGTVLTTTGSVTVFPAAPVQLLFTQNEDPISSCVLSPFYSTDLASALADPVGNIVEVTSTVSSLAFTGSGITFTTGVLTDDRRFFPFTASAALSGTYQITGSIGYLAKNFVEVVPAKYVNTRVKKITVESTASGFAPYSVYVDKPFGIQIKVDWVNDSGQVAQNFIAANYTNPNLLDGKGFDDNDKTFSFLQLFDVYLGSTKLTTQLSVQPEQGPIVNLIFHQSALSLFASAEPLPLTVRLKDTGLASSRKLTILIQDEPFSIQVVNTQLDRFRSSS